MNDHDHSRKLTWGILLITVGLVLLARTLGMISSDELWRTLLAFAFIALGIYVIVRKRRREHFLEEQRQHAGQQTKTDTSPGGEARAGSASWTSSTHTSSQESGTRSAFSEAPSGRRDGDIEYRKLLGDMFIDADGLGFENIEISAGIGDLELRLKGARLNGKLNRVVISGFVGDVRVYVPADMAYSASCSNFIGDIDVAGKHASGFGNNVSAFSPEYDTADKKLYIAANSFIGDIKILLTD